MPVAAPKRAGLVPSELLKAAEAYGNIDVPSCLLASTAAAVSTDTLVISVLPKDQSRFTWVSNT